MTQENTGQTQKQGKQKPLLEEPQPTCPQCKSTKICKDGMRYLKNGEAIQRWLCKNCGYRFSDSKAEKDCNQTNMLKYAQKVQRQVLNSPSALTFNCQGSGEALSGAPSANKAVKTLAEVETRIGEAQREGAASRITTDIILNYAWKAKKKGLAESTITQRVIRLKQLTKKGANLMDPDSVLTVLATNNWTDNNKKVFITTYKSFAKTFNIVWEPPKVRVQRRLPFIPTEEELDQLIAGCGKKTATFLQVLKDTGARTAEAIKLKWIDIDQKTCTIRINNPVKGSLPRIIKVPPKTIAMINKLPKTSEFIFATSANSIRRNFYKQRLRISVKLQNPRLKQIHLHTFRHWKATMEYHRTKDIKWVQKLLGHKKLENTDLYTQLINFESDEWHVATAKNLEEEKKLIEAGFEFVRYSEKDEVAIYRKRK